MRTLLSALLLSALASAATHNGDGTFGLFAKESIGSHIGYVVVLDGIGQENGLAAGQAAFTIYAPDGTVADSVVLDSGGTYNASFPGDGVRITGRILSIRMYGTGYGPAPDGSIAQFARVKVSSADFGTPAPLTILSMDVLARKYDATVSWETNDGSNGTAYVYDSSSRLVNSSADAAGSESHSVRVGGLEPDTPYTVIAESCDLSCVRSAPQGFRTFGGENRSAEEGARTSSGPNKNTTQNIVSGAPDGLFFANGASVPVPPQAPPFLALGALSSLAIIILRR